MKIFKVTVQPLVGGCPTHTYVKAPSGDTAIQMVKSMHNLHGPGVSLSFRAKEELGDLPTP